MTGVNFDKTQVFAFNDGRATSVFKWEPKDSKWHQHKSHFTDGQYSFYTYELFTEDEFHTKNQSGDFGKQLSAEDTATASHAFKSQMGLEFK